MFSGIVEGIGTVLAVSSHQNRQFEIETPWSCVGRIGDSIAVNGVCLTVKQINKNSFICEAVPETLRCSSLGSLSLADEVNLERALCYGDRVGGHLVQGHVDGTGTIVEIKKEGEGAWLVTFEFEASLNRFLVDKGFITIDGMSITVIKAQANTFTVTLIPHTIATTIAKHYQTGTQVNLEVDMFAKYWVKNNDKKSD